MPASSLSFTGCPYKYFYEPDSEDPYLYADKEKLHYLAENGKAKHLEFQEELRKLEKDVKLYDPVDISKIHPKCQFKLSVNQRYGLEPLENIELPFYIEEYNMMGFIDGILSIKGIQGPVIIDFKNKTINDKSQWKNFVKTVLPLEKDVAQLAAYKYVINKLDYFKEKCKYVGIIYYNGPLVGDLDAEQEFYLDIPDEIIAYMLDTRNKNRIRFLNNEASFCDYRFCKDHGSEKLFIKDWIVKI